MGLRGKTILVTALWTNTKACLETKAFLPDTKAFLPVPQFRIVLVVFEMSESQSNGTKGCNSRAHNPSKPCQSAVFPIDQLWHHCHLQQVCWFPFILAILDHLEQERFWEAATFFYSNDQNKCCFRQKPKKGAPGRHRYVYNMYRTNTWIWYVCMGDFPLPR